MLFVKRFGSESEAAIGGDNEGGSAGWDSSDMEPGKDKLYRVCSFGMLPFPSSFDEVRKKDGQKLSLETPRTAFSNFGRYGFTDCALRARTKNQSMRKSLSLAPNSAESNGLRSIVMRGAACA